MRIVHLRNIANTHNLVTAQRELGHEVKLWSTGHPERKLNQIPVDDNNPWTDPVRWNLWMLSRLRKLNKFDVVHAHGGIWRSWLAYHFLKNPVLALHFHGTDLRMAVGHYYQDLAEIKFISTPDDRRWVPDGIWLPQPVEIPTEPFYRTGNEKPLFTHFFIREKTKRTHKIIEMFDEAFGPLEYSVHPRRVGTEEWFTGKEAELRTYHGIPPGAVHEMMEQSDVIFDQMTFYKVYGAVSAEAMARGRPTLVPFDPELYPEDCPILRPNVKMLRKLAEDPEFRELVGRKGRAYASRVHDRLKVAQLTIDTYKRFL